jgi:hypothetical protein
MQDLSRHLRVVTFSPGPYNYHFPLPCYPNFKILQTNKMKKFSIEAQNTIDRADIFLMENNPGLNRAKRKYPWVFNIVQNSGKPWIVIEAAMFRKNHIKPPWQGSYYRWSWFSYFRNEGNYCNQNSPDDRWKRIQAEQNITIRPWQKHRGDYILFMMQRPGDTSLSPVDRIYGSYENYIFATITNIRKHSSRPIRIRLHPQSHNKQLPLLKKVLEMPGVSISNNSIQIQHKSIEGGDSLEQDLAGAWAVVGFNSNSLTESACLGIPTWSLHSSSMAWEVSHLYLSQIENPNLNIDRTQWLYNLGYTQWRQDEVIAGMPFKHLLTEWEKINGSMAR